MLHKLPSTTTGLLIELKTDNKTINLQHDNASSTFNTIDLKIQTEKKLESKEIQDAATLATLNIHESPTTESLRSVSTPSPSVAWASGENGTVVRTVDSGKTWECQQISDAAKLSFRSIKAFDADTAYIMSSGDGEASRIYKTKNGGKTWELQLVANTSAEFFNCLAFWNQDRGMVLSDPVENKFKIYLTENGGNTWLPISPASMPMALSGEGAFAASGSCMTVQGSLNAWFGTGGKNARIFHSENGGKNWQVSKTPIMQDTDSAGIFSIAFYDAKNGVISGGDYNQPDRSGSNLAITQDGGLSWSLTDLSPQYYWSAVAFAPDHENMMVVGSKLAGYTSKESPRVWQKKWDVSLNALSFWSNNKTLAVGPKGSIMEFELPKKSL